MPFLADIPRVPGGCEVMITPPGILGKVVLPAGATKVGRTRQLIAPRRGNALLCHHRGAPLPSLPVVSAFRPSRWRRWRPQAGDQCEDFLEHLSRHRDLGHLKRDVAPVADDLRADLDQLRLEAGQ
jgi:hypothetical protein